MTNQMGQPKALPATTAGSATAHLTMNAVPREMNYFPVTEAELNTLYTAGNLKTLDLAMFTLSVGIAVTLLVTLLTVDIANVRVNAAFWAVFVVSLLASLFFGFRAKTAWDQASDTFAQIKQPRKVA